MQAVTTKLILSTMVLLLLDSIFTKQTPKEKYKMISLQFINLTNERVTALRLLRTAEIIKEKL